MIDDPFVAGMLVMFLITVGAAFFVSLFATSSRDSTPFDQMPINTPPMPPVKTPRGIHDPMCNVTIDSDGLTQGTQVFVDNVEMTGVHSIHIHPMTAGDDDVVTVTITIKGMTL